MAEVSADDISLTCTSGLRFQHPIHPYTSDREHPYDIVCAVAPYGDDSLDPESVTLRYRVDGGAFAQLPMIATGNPSEFAAAIAAQPWGSLVEYYLSAENSLDEVYTHPAGAPELLHRFAVNDGFLDALEAPGGWSTGWLADDAVSGIWERVDPNGTEYSGYAVQPEDDHTPFPGAHCFVTGNAPAGEAAGLADVDWGRTTLYSPVFDLRGGQDVALSYWRWYTNDRGYNPGEDFWTTEISNDGGQTWTEVERTTASSNAWVEIAFDLNEYFALPGFVQLRFIAEDLLNGSLVEAAVDDLVLSGLFDATGLPGAAPVAAAALGRNYPNPFNPSTTIPFTLAEAGPVDLRIFDTRGRLLRALVNEVRSEGDHTILWDGRDDRGRSLGSGLYLYRLAAGGEVLTRPMILIK